MGTTLYVGNLSHQADVSDLRELFAQFGTVRRTEIIAAHEAGRVAGVGVVEMSSEDEAQAAIAGLNGKAIDGRTLTVNEANSLEARGGFGGDGVPGQ